MITIKKSELIPILQTSGLVQLILGDVMIVPEKYHITQSDLKNIKTTFYKVMNSLRYFMVDELPKDVYDFVFRNKNVDISLYKDFHYNKLLILQNEQNHIYNCEHCKVSVKTNIYQCAAFNYVKLMLYLINDKEIEIKQHDLIAALKHHNNECFEILCKKNEVLLLSENISLYAVKYQNLEAIKYLRSLKYDFTRKTSIIGSLALAAHRGYINICKYFVDNDIIEVTSRVLEQAAGGGHFETLQFLCENSCKKCRGLCEHTTWDYTTTGAAGGEGHLEILQYLCENGCEINEYCLHIAFIHNHPMIVQYYMKITKK